MPTATDLVTDLPADFEVFGQAVATSMADLLGGTSGQILAKNSNTDMDFVWVANDVGDITAVTAGTGISGGGTSGAVTVTNSMATAITTAGDLIKGTGSGTFDRLGIGSSGQVLTVTAGAPAWAAPAGGGKVLQMVTATTTTPASSTSTSWTDTGLSATITPSAASSKILAMFYQMGAKGGSDVDNGLNIQILRGATQILIAQDIGYTGTNISNVAATNLLYVDSPSTTAATTYKTQFRSSISGSTTSVNSNSNIAIVVLLEIGA